MQEPDAVAAGDPSVRLDGISILIIDDHRLFREGLRLLLQGLGDDVGIAEAESFEEARALISKARTIDVILADLVMSGEDGFEGLKALRDQAPAVPVVVVSMLEESKDVLRALECGARGYIPKSSSSEVMLSALRLVFAGGVYLPPTLITEASSSMPRGRGLAEGGRVAPLGGALDQLTPRQHEVLMHLCEGKSNRDIADTLGLAEGTVKVHVTAVLRALGVKNRTQAVLAAGVLGQG